MNVNGYEIERKFEIEYPTAAELDAMLAVPGARSVKITQVYLTSDDGGSRRIRRSESDGNVKYRMTVKRGSGIVREERETEITADEYERLLSEAEAGLMPINKVRICVPSGDRVIEIDLYDGFTDYAVAEVELTAADEQLPDMSCIHVIREVTGEYAWLNRAIAKHGMPEK